LNQPVILMKVLKKQKAHGQIDMKKYIVETISTFRSVHVVEAENDEQAFAIASEADDNWQEWLGVTKLDVSEFTESRVQHFREKQYWWDGSCYLNEMGAITYKHPNEK